MARNYYSTQPFLAWCFNHFFYRRHHFAYIGAPFYPYRLTNPASSNPWKMFGAQYEPVIDADPYDAVLQQKRLNLQKGVGNQVPPFPPSAVTALNAICARVDPIFFAPIVYRVDVDAIPDARKTVSGSGTVGSNEHLITDLDEGEFDILFFDATSDPQMADLDLRQLGSTLLGGADSLSLSEAFGVLWGRLIP